MSNEASFVFLLVGFMGPAALIGIVAAILAHLPDKKHDGDQQEAAGKG